MSAHVLVDKLKQLSHAHESVTELERKLATHQEVISSKQKFLAAIQTQKMHLSQEEKTDQKHLDAIQMELNIIEEQYSALQSKIRLTKKPRELAALEKEMSALVEEKQRVQELLSRTLKQVGSNKQALTQKRHHLVAQEAEVLSELTTNGSLTANLRSEISCAQEKRDALITDIPVEWRSKYNRMLGSVNNPIVEINNSVCGACFYTIVEKDLYKVKHGEILNCRNCYRLMYANVPDAATKVAKEPNY